jgi:hypothetical protein
MYRPVVLGRLELPLKKKQVIVLISCALADYEGRKPVRPSLS